MLLDLALLPLRIARHVVGVLADAVTPAPAPPGKLVVVDGMPEGVPPAARRPEPQLPTPAGWPFGEEFPRTCGAGRLAGGALFWTDFLYDDHGATGLPVGMLKFQAPPRGTYIYPTGPASNNGADIFRAAVGLTDTDTWWRVDWNTLLDASVPIALFTFATGRGAAAEAWPAGAGDPLGGHRHGPARLRLRRLADRPRHRGQDPGRSQRRPGVPVVPGPGPAVAAGARRHLDCPVGGGTGEQRR